MTYWIRKAGKIVGPLSKEDIEGRLRSRALGSLDEVSVDRTMWTKLWKSEFWNRQKSATQKSSLGRHGGFVHPRARLSPEQLRSSMPQPEPAEADIPLPPPLPMTGRSERLKTYEEEMRGRPPPLPRKTGIRKLLFFGVPAASILLLVGIIAIVSAVTSKPVRPSTPSSSASSNSGAGSASGTMKTGYLVGNDLDPSAADENIRPIIAYLAPSYDEIAQTFQYVVSSPYITRNPLYSDLTRNTRLYYVPRDDQVNAFSSAGDPFEKEGAPTMIVLGGAVRFSRLVGAVLATDERDPEESDRVETLLNSFQRRFRQEKGKLSIELFCDLLDDCNVPEEVFHDGAWLAKAKSISSGILLGILAHETGHLALGHNFSDETNLEARRNMEREADSVAFSIASTASFGGEEMFFGNFLFHFFFSMFENADGTGGWSDHPDSRERLFNLLRAHPDFAFKFGITEEELKRRLNEFH